MPTSLGATAFPERFLRHTNRLTREHGLYEGRRLVIRSRYVVGAVDALAGAREADFTLRRIAGHVSALASLQFRVAPDGTLVGAWDDEAMAVCRGRGVEVLAVCRLSAADEPPRALLHRLLHNRKTRHACIEQWAEVLNRPDAGGLVVDLPGLLLGDGSRFVRFVQALSNAVHARGKRLIAGVPVPVRGIRGRLQLADVDWRRLAEAADGVLLQTHVPPPGAGAPVAARRAAMGQGPVRPGAPLEGCARRKPRRVGGSARVPLNELTYQQAVALAFGRGRRPVWDDRLQLHVGAYRTAGEQPEERTFGFSAHRRLRTTCSSSKHTTCRAPSFGGSAVRTGRVAGSAAPGSRLQTCRNRRRHIDSARMDEGGSPKMSLRLKKQTVRMERILGEGRAETVAEGTVRLPERYPAVGRAPIRYGRTRGHSR